MHFVTFAFWVGVCAHGATWKHLDLLSSKTGPQTDRQSCLRARKEGVREQDRAIITPSIAGGETITERLCLKGSRKEMKRAPWREKAGGGHGAAFTVIVEKERLQHGRKRRMHTDTHPSPTEAFCIALAASE